MQKKHAVRAAPFLNSTSPTRSINARICLVRHGGHAAAAGFTVRNEKLPELVSRLKSIAKAQLSGKDLHPTLTADMEVSLSQLNFDLLKHLAYFEPTGYGNPSAIFVSRDVKVKSARTVGSEGKHLKLALEDEHGAAYERDWFPHGKPASRPVLARGCDVFI